MEQNCKPHDKQQTDLIQAPSMDTWVNTYDSGG